MAVFRKYQSPTDRSYKDRLEHWQLIKKAIRENIQEIIAEEAIIAKRGNEIIKVPIKQIKEYKLTYQEEKSPQVGQSGSSKKPGDILGPAQKKGKGSREEDKISGKKDQQIQSGLKPEEGGDELEREIYEKEKHLPYNELLDIVFDDLELPEIERKKFKDVISRVKRKIKGRRKKGIRSRLDKKKSAIQRIKRKKAAQRGGRIAKDQDFPFHQEDLRYKRMVEKKEKYSNAAIYFIRDVSWSMSQFKVYLTKLFFLLLYLFIQSKYKNTDLVFIGHHTRAKEEENEEQFFRRVSDGGTHMSSGYEKALEIIEKRHNPEHWNIYAFHCSDGDNFKVDNDKALELAKKLCQISNLFGYCEVKPNGQSFSSMIKIFDAGIKFDNFAIAKISRKEDVYPMFKGMLKKERIKVPK